MRTGAARRLQSTASSRSMGSNASDSASPCPSICRFPAGNLALFGSGRCQSLYAGFSEKPAFSRAPGRTNSDQGTGASSAVLLSSANTIHAKWEVVGSPENPFFFQCETGVRLVGVLVDSCTGSERVRNCLNQEGGTHFQPPKNLGAHLAPERRGECGDDVSGKSIATSAGTYADDVQ